MARRSRWGAISRFWRRYRGECPRPRPPSSGAGTDRTGGESSGTPPTCIRFRKASVWRRGSSTTPSPTWCSSPIPERRPMRPPSRLRGSTTRPTAIPNRFRIVTFEGAFHGRTLATLAAGGQAKYLEGFGPKVDGFDQVPFNDIPALEAAIGPDTAALMIEPIQGEGGIRPVPGAFLQALRALCDEHGILLILTKFKPASGAPESSLPTRTQACRLTSLLRQRHWRRFSAWERAWRPPTPPKDMTLGSHGTTFGGNPLAMAVGNAVLDVILAPGFLEQVKRKGLLAQAAACLAQRQASGHHRGDPRRGVDDGNQDRGWQTPNSSKRPSPKRSSSSARATMSCAFCRRSSSRMTKSHEAMERLEAVCTVLEAGLKTEAQRGAAL